MRFLYYLMTESSSETNSEDSKDKGGSKDSSKEEIVKSVLEDNDYRCVECGRHIDERDMCLTYKDGSEKEFSRETLEVVCEDDLEGTNIHSLSTDDSGSDDDTSVFGYIDDYLLNHSIYEVKVRRPFLGVLLYFITVLSILFVALYPVITGAENLLFVSVPLSSISVGVVYLFERYTEEFGRDEENQILEEIGVIVGIISSVVMSSLYVFEFIGITEYSSWQSGQLSVTDGSLFGQVYGLSLIGVIVGGYSLYMLILNDKTELLNRSLESAGRKRNGELKSSIAVAINMDDSIQFTDFNRFKYQFVAVVLMVAYVVMAVSSGLITSIFTYIFAIVVTVLPALFYTYYVVKRHRMYDSLDEL
jgi:hypothetical protein